MPWLAPRHPPTSRETAAAGVLPAVSRWCGWSAGRPSHIPDREPSAAGPSDPPRHASFYCSAGARGERHGTLMGTIEEENRRHKPPSGGRITSRASLKEQVFRCIYWTTHIWHVSSKTPVSSVLAQGRALRQTSRIIPVYYDLASCLLSASYDN